MGKRVSLAKKTRFEVFKRDNFKCQYCGKSAPDVVLEVDHIKSIAEGGSNDMLNLITSCFECNRGKGKKLLSDNSVVEKKRQQLEELNERRIQIDMMMEWQEELLKTDDYQVNKLCDYITKIGDVVVKDSGKELLKKYIKKYGFEKVLESIKISFDQYDDSEKAFNKIPKIIVNTKRMEEKPYLKDLYYIRGIAKNRFSYINELRAIQLLEKAYENKATIESLKSFTLSCKNWTEFRSGLENYIEQGANYSEEFIIKIDKNNIKDFKEKMNEESKKIIECLSELIKLDIDSLEDDFKNIDETTKEGNLYKYKNLCKIEAYKSAIQTINELYMEWDVEVNLNESDNKSILIPSLYL